MISQQTAVNKQKTVYVAMSGGVDSSVAAALLKKEGFSVRGVFFKPWAPFAEASEGQAAYCCDWQQDRLDAMQVAEVLNIPFATWDFSQEYKKKVGDYMISSYRQGLTPNPDVMCNKEIKFGLFLKKALADGADFIATGHYVRSVKKGRTYQLLKAKDKNKDQSYFLWTLTQKQLAYCLFPIGHFTKPQVRILAKKFGLPTHNKKDSQGVCFIGQLKMDEFLKGYIPPRPGEIRCLETEEKVGEHPGVAYYTLGQRHGLDIKNGHGPYYVLSKDRKNNILWVTTQEEKLAGREIKVKEVNWIEKKPTGGLNLEIKPRYRAADIPAKIKPQGQYWFLTLKHPARALTAGQSIVFYKKEVVLGGGVIF